MHTVTRCVLLAVFSVVLAVPASAQSGTDATLTFAQEREEQARRQLRRLLSEYDLDPWIFTRTVKIEAGAIPRSHPIATLNTSNLDADREQLAVFLHEQIHWFEEQARRQLRRLLSEYDLDPWIVTRTVKIEAGAIPRSHPVLTLNTSNLDADREQLAVFLHEQIHWFEEQNDAATDRAIETLKQMYPDPPDHEEIGTRSEYSTYLHLVVNWLELDALGHLIGEEEARALTDEDDIYRWVNQRVLADTDAIGAVLEKHGLIIDPEDQ